MKRIFDIGFTDFRIFFRHRSAYVWLFLLPLGFVYFLGLAMPPSGEPANRTVRVMIENPDPGFMGRIFVDELKSQNVVAFEPGQRGTVAGTVRIPADFTARVFGQETGKVEFTPNENAAPADTAVIEARLGRAMIVTNGHLLEAAALAAGGAITEAHFREVLARPDRITLDAHFDGRNPQPAGFSFSLPGNLVMYLLMNLAVFGGNTLAEERRRGILRRLSLFPLRNVDIVMGKIYGLMLLAAVQVLFLVLAGKFLFKVNLGANLPEVILVLLVFAWVAASVGVLLGSLTVSPDRVNGLCVLVSLVAAALGGCWFPLEIGPPILRTISFLFPTGWALEALHAVISFGNGFSAIVVPLLVLAGFGLVLNVLALRFFRA